LGGVESGVDAGAGAACWAHARLSRRWVNITVPS